MALGKKTTPKKAVQVAKTPKTPVKVLHLSDRELVLKLEKDAICLSVKDGFVVYADEIDGKSLHSGIAKSEKDAWKLAAHNL